MNVWPELPINSFIWVAFDDENGGNDIDIGCGSKRNNTIMYLQFHSSLLEIF